jgi:hypothetical protein
MHTNDQPNNKGCIAAERSEASKYSIGEFKATSDSKPPRSANSRSQSPRFNTKSNTKALRFANLKPDPALTAPRPVGQGGAEWHEKSNFLLSVAVLASCKCDVFERDVKNALPSKCGVVKLWREL